MENCTILPPHKIYRFKNPDRVDMFSDSDVEEDAYFHFLVCGVLQFLLSSFGTFGSFSTLMVLLRPDSNAISYIFLLSIVICDLLILVPTLFGLTIPQLIKYTFGPSGFFMDIAPTLAIYSYPIINIGLAGTTFFTGWAILERYVVLCRPFGTMRFMSHGTAYKFTCFQFLFCVIINISRFFEFEKGHDEHNASTHLKLEFRPTGLMGTFIYRKYYLFVFWFTSRFVVPYCLMIFSIFAILYEIIVTSGSEMPSAARRNEIELGKMTMYIAILYLFSNGMNVTNRLLRGFFSTKPILPLVYISNVTLLFNVSFKWLIFYNSKDRFRDHYVQIITLPFSAVIEILGWIYPEHRYFKNRKAHSPTLLRKKSNADLLSIVSIKYVGEAL